ncbi:dTMP kinase [Streptantibioticus parmotrematis]|uniref:dTMP kinase n=1 Tax=Streptantibioticus parmotrematis TaxID=2873249 RepID=UPI0033C63AFE
MTRAEQPTGEPEDFTNALAADSRERAVTALLRIPALRRLWTAQVTSSVGDRLGLLALLALAVQAAVAQQVFGGGYRGVSFAIAVVFGLRLLAGLLFGAVLLGPLSTLTAPQGVLDRRWTMIGSDAVRLGLFVVAPLWIDWLPSSALTWLLVTVFVTGVAERVWNVAKDGAAPALLPAPPADGVRPGPDHLDALRRLDLRTGFVALPVAAAGLIAAALVNNLLGVWSPWFATHHVALVSYVAAGLFAASVAVLYLLELPGGATPRPRSPLEGLRLPKGPAGAEKGRTGALPTLVLSCAAVAGAIAASVAVAVLHAVDLGFGPVGFGLLVVALTGGVVWGIRTAPRVLPTLSRRRLLGLAIGVTGIALLLTGLVPDPVTVLALSLLAGYAAGLAANTGHTLIDQEAQEARRTRTTEHLHAVVRVAVAVAAVAAPAVAGLIGPHRLVDGSFTFDHGGAAFTLMLVGALLLPVAALVIGTLDDRQGVPLRRDLREALRGDDPAQAPAASGFFIAVEGGDGAGKSTQVEALAEWIRGKGHEVVVTREPGATAIGKRLRSILLDVASAGISHRAEALLYAADRAEHVDSVVRPALDRGAIVISDRYIDSSVAYQGAGRDLAPTEIARISRWATGGLVPHLTVLLDVSPQTARERFTEAPDRLESEPAEFHDRVRRGFLTLAAADPSRYLVVDAGQEPQAVTRVVRHRLDHLLPLSQQEIEARAEAERKAAEEARRRAEEEAARKAEEERLERERQEQLAKLRAEEEERKRQEEERRKREEAERQAEAARQAAEAARKRAEEERTRREAEERARAEEQERLRRQKEEQDRLRSEAEARRLEKQRKAEEALLRAEHAREQARLAEEARRAEEARLAEEARRAEETRRAQEAARTPAEPECRADAEPEGPSGRSSEGPDAETTQTVETPAAAPTPRADDVTQTVETPHLGRTDETRTDETRTIEVPAVQDPAAGGSADPAAGRRTDPDAEATTVMPAVRPSAPADDETAVLPPVRPVRPSASDDETAVLPPVRPAGGDRGNPADRVPPGLFRDERAESSVERTRELPQVTDPNARGGANPQAKSGEDVPPRPAKRPRPSWAEETPLDDLPTLADELLGPRDEDDHRDEHHDDRDERHGERQDERREGRRGRGRR